MEKHVQRVCQNQHSLVFVNNNESGDVGKDGEDTREEKERYIMARVEMGAHEFV